jgi:hypothetical protein
VPFIREKLRAKLSLLSLPSNALASFLFFGSFFLSFGLRDRHRPHGTIFTAAAFSAEGAGLLRYLPDLKSSAANVLVGLLITYTE